MNIAVLAENLNFFGLIVFGCLVSWAIFTYLRYYTAGLEAAKKENKILFVVNVGSGSFGILLGLANIVGGTNDFRVSGIFSIIWLFTSIPLFFSGKP